MASFFENPELQGVIEKNRGASQNVFQPNALMDGAFSFGKMAATSGVVNNEDLRASAQQFTDKPIYDKDMQRQEVRDAVLERTEKLEQDIQSGKQDASKYFDEAKKKKNISISEALSLGALALVPSLVGYAIGGSRGGYEGAKAGQNASGNYYDALVKERESIRDITAGQGQAALEEAAATGKTIDQMESEAFGKELDIIAPKVASPGLESRIRLRIPRRDGTAGSEVVEVFRSSDGSVRDLSGRPIPEDILSVAQSGFRSRPRVDYDSKLIVVEDDFAPGGRRILRPASISELQSGMPVDDSAGVAPMYNQMPVSSASSVAPASEQVVEPVREGALRIVDGLIGRPGPFDDIGQYRAEDLGAAGSLNSEIDLLLEEKKLLQNRSALEAGLSPQAKRDAISDLDKQISDKRNEQGSEATTGRKALEKVRDLQATQKAGFELIADIAGLKEDVNTGFMSEPISMLTRKFDILADSDREKLRSKLIDQTASFIKSISGSAVSNEERIQLLKGLPTPDDDDAVFVSKLQTFAEAVERKRQEALESSGLFAPVKRGRIQSAPSLKDQLRKLTPEQRRQRIQELEGSK